MSPSTNKLPVPDPNASPVGRRLLVYKRTLNGVLEQVQRNLDPKKFLRKDFELHMNDLESLIKGIEELMDNRRNKPMVGQFLGSAFGVKEEVAEARRQLWSASMAIDIIHSPTANIAKQMESAVELDKALEKCRKSLKEAISQFRI